MERCYCCMSTFDLHTHEVYFGRGKRKISKQMGFTQRLCGRHHNLSDEGVHFNKELDTKLKTEYQRKFIDQMMESGLTKKQLKCIIKIGIYGYEEGKTMSSFEAIDLFIKIIGRNYL